MKSYDGLYRILLQCGTPYMYSCKSLFLLFYIFIYISTVAQQLNCVYSSFNFRCYNPFLQAMLSISKLHMTVGDLDAAQQQLVTLLRSDDKNNAATVVRK